MTAVVMTSVYQLGTAPPTTPIGHLIHSIYDYVVSESLGFHVDYSKSLKQLKDEAERKHIELPDIKQSQADSLVEKCSTAILEMHRPIYKGRTATEGKILTTIDNRKAPLGRNLTLQAYEFIHETLTFEEPEEVMGRISSYNKNTYKGRIFDKNIGRPVSFELKDSGRNKKAVDLITRSLHANALNQSGGEIFCKAYRTTSRSGQLKGFLINQVSRTSIS